MLTLYEIKIIDVSQVYTTEIKHFAVQEHNTLDALERAFDKLGNASLAEYVKQVNLFCNDINELRDRLAEKEVYFTVAILDV